jgi:hypothetical protein
MARLVQPELNAAKPAALKWSAKDATLQRIKIPPLKQRVVYEFNFAAKRHYAAQQENALHKFENVSDRTHMRYPFAAAPLRDRGTEAIFLAAHFCHALKWLIGKRK